MADNLDKKFNEFISNEVLKKRRTSYCENYNVNIYNQVICDNEALIHGIDKLKKNNNEIFLRKASANSINYNVVNKMAHESNSNAINKHENQENQHFMKVKSNIEQDNAKKNKNLNEKKYCATQPNENFENKNFSNLRRNSSIIYQGDVNDEPDICIPKKFFKQKDNNTQKDPNDEKELIILNSDDSKIYKSIQKVHPIFGRKNNFIGDDVKSSPKDGASIVKLEKILSNNPVLINKYALYNKVPFLKDKKNSMPITKNQSQRIVKVQNIESNDESPPSKAFIGNKTHRIGKISGQNIPNKNDEKVISDTLNCPNVSYYNVSKQNFNTNPVFNNDNYDLVSKHHKSFSKNLKKQLDKKNEFKKLTVKTDFLNHTNNYKFSPKNKHQTRINT